MLDAAFSETVSETPRVANGGTRTFKFGRPVTSTEDLLDRSSSTNERDIRKSIQFDPEGSPPKTSSQHFSFSPEEYFKPIKNWEGVVAAVNDSHFSAVMRDLGDATDKGEEEFEIDIEDVDVGDRDLVVPGGIFYFTVGYRIRRGGTRIKGTQIVFRRLPAWSKKDIRRAEARANKLSKIMNLDGRVDRTS